MAPARICDHQTDENGQPNRKILKERVRDIAKELVFGCSGGSQLKTGCFHGIYEGVEIEKVAHETPEKF